LDPYEGRLLILQFMEPLEAAAWQAQQEAKTMYLAETLSPGYQAVLSPEALLITPPPQVADLPSDIGRAGHAAVEAQSGQVGAGGELGEDQGCSTWKGLVATAEEKNKRLAHQVNDLTASLQQLRQQQQQHLQQVTAPSAARDNNGGAGAPHLRGHPINWLKGAMGPAGMSGHTAAPAGVAAPGDDNGGRLVEASEGEEVAVPPTVVLLVVTNVFWLCMVVLLGCWGLQRRPRKSDRYLY
jgi:hypothetical protein